MEEFLIQYGLLAVFLCAVAENDVTFLLGGVVVHLGMMPPESVVLAGVAGALAHDSIWFWIGHARADRIRASRVYRRVGPAIERLAARFGPAELFLCRFLYGTRTPSLVFWGVQRLSATKFLLINGSALLLWGSILATVGYFLSNLAVALIGRVKSLEHWMLWALFIGTAGFLAARLFTRHEIKKRLRRRTPDDLPD